MVSHNEAASRHDKRARERPALNTNTGTGFTNIGAPTNSRRSTGYLGRNGRHADSSRRNSAPGNGLPTAPHLQNDRGTANYQGLNYHGNPNASCVLLLLAADTSTGAVRNEASPEPDDNAFTTPTNRRMVKSSPTGPSPSFSGSRLRRLLPENQRPPAPMTPLGHEPPAAMTMSASPIRMFNRPKGKGKSVEEQYVLPSPPGSNITVPKRDSFRKRSNKWAVESGDDDAAKRKLSNPNAIAVVTGRKIYKPRQKPVSERPILRMRGDREQRYL
ncbi:uncharacterized protein J4E84_006930 [Alternaria hordeiaustralica]|uniref:uncharacterized protein n=1 Tax=Alternaria hordeiaustralica TaxID=1187925 RepID=UPI0020C304E4|nr:uncharacterized protein J4E84_006930 [Alternaria hordeiaustralica]KAI4683028.1 hypothetical protein J4E84_006930 [Alternaria hordeiaustralica]